MPKSLLRFVGLVLIPGLVADPAFASGFQTKNSSRPLVVPLKVVFDEQALSPTGDIFGGKELTRTSTVRVDQKATRASGYSRRAFLTAGLSFLGLRQVRLMAQGGQTPATPAQTEQVRRDILNL